MRFPILASLFLGACVLQSCYNDKRDQLYPAPVNNTCDTTNVTYSGTVSAIMSANCASSGCHNSATNSAGYSLDNYNGVRAAAIGPRFFGAINHAPGFSPMPKTGAKLSDCDIKKLSVWVAAGAPNN